MAHDVFISCASEDKPVGDAICATLEANLVRSWIAPRDIRPGADWGEAIVKAIAASRVFVLVFSSNANISEHIKREVERAVNQGLPIIPVRIEDVVPQGALEYYLSTPHWLDAFQGELAEHLAKLTRIVRLLLDREPEEPLAVAGAAAVPSARTATIPAPSPRMSKPLFLCGSFASFGLILISFLEGDDTSPGSWIGCGTGAAAMLAVTGALYYRAWSAIQDGHARLSPARALWSLLIPGYNIYALFQVIWGFAADYNRFMARNPAPHSRRLPDDWLLIHSVLSLAIYPFLFAMLVAWGRAFHVGALAALDGNFVDGMGWLSLLAFFANFVLGVFMTIRICDAVNAAGIATAKRAG